MHIHRSCALIVPFLATMLTLIGSGRGLAATSAFLPVAAGTNSPTEWDGLQRQPSKRVSLLYTRPGASLASYKRVRLEPLQVAFDKNWDPNSRTSTAARLTRDDFETIKKTLAEEFAKVSAEELAKGGYTVVAEADEDVLDVAPSVVDLYITAPEKKSAGRTRTYVANAGHMTLVAELRDSNTGQVLARAIDKVRGSQTGSFQLASSVTNRAEARRAIAKWASALRDALDEANGRSGPT